MDDTLPLLARVLAILATLDRLPIRNRLRDEFSSTSSSFFGGTFSLPRPGRPSPRDSASSSFSPFPRLGPPDPAAAAFSCDGEAIEGVLWVLVRVPPRPPEEGGGNVMPKVGVVGVAAVPVGVNVRVVVRREGRNIELDRVNGGCG